MSDFDTAIRNLRVVINAAAWEAECAGRDDTPDGVAIFLGDCRDHLQSALQYVEAAQAAADLTQKET